MKKRIMALLLAVVMLLGMMPVTVAAATSVPVNGNVVDIADNTLNLYTVQTVQIYLQSSFAAVDIVSATQDGTVIDVVLAADTALDAALQAGFAGSGAQGISLNHGNNKCTLSNGTGKMEVTVTPYGGGRPQGPSATYTINFSVVQGDSYNVSIPTGEGFSVTGNSKVYAGANYGFTVTVAEGYDATNLVVKVNGEAIEGSNGNYAVANVSGDLVITVEGIVEKERCTVTAPTGEGFTFTGAAMVYKGESYTFQIAVDKAYNGENLVVKAGEQELTGTNGSYTIDAVNEDITITVSGIAKKETYTVTLTEGVGYTLSGAATGFAGEDYTFSVTLDDETYKAAEAVVKVDGEPVTLTGGKYTIPALDGNKVVTVENVTERTLFTVTKPAVAGVTVTGGDSVREGKPYTFSVTVGDDYNASAMVVKVNGEAITLSNGSYTIDTVNANVEILVEGVVEKTVYTVTAPIGEKFTFTGGEKVYEGDDYTFTVKTGAAYGAIVKVNGEVITGTNGSYTVPAVSQNLVITVEVTRAPLPDTQLAVDGNVIDICDKKFASRSSYHATATTITIGGVDVMEAYEDGTNVYVILARDTADDATVSVTVNYSQNRYTVVGNTGSVQLQDGDGSATLTLTGKYNNSSSSNNGSVTYNVIFFRELPPTEPPVCVQNSDSLEVWKGHYQEINLSKYFSGADQYYIFDGRNVTLVTGKLYKYVPAEVGEQILTVSAENEIGKCKERLTLTINVKNVESGIYIGHATSNGSMDLVQFFDSDGNPIQGLDVGIEGKIIRVTLPKNYALNGTVKAVFTLTQNGGLPFITTKTGTSGTSSGKAVNNKFTEKNVTLSAGAATFTFYYYNVTPTTINNPYETWSLVYVMANDLPVLAEGVKATAEASMVAGETYALDLAPLFTDIDGDALTYKVSINGAAAVAADAAYTYTTEVAGTYTLVFIANDGKGDSVATYTVTLTVEDSKQTDSMNVIVPADAEPRFYVCSGYAGGVDQLGAEVETGKGETTDGLTAYTIHYPTNADAISVRAEGWGGMVFGVEKEGTVTLRQMQLEVVDYENKAADSKNTVTYGDYAALAGTNGWLLVTGVEYTITAEPVDTTTLAKVTKKETLEAGAEIYRKELMLNIQNPMAITVPTGARAQLYKYNKYYDNDELDAKIVTENEDGTTTYQFIADTKANGASYIYRVSMEGKITKAGWLAWGQQNLTVTYTDADKSPSYRLNDYTGTGAANSSYTEDSVLLNINSRNHLSMSVGQSKVLKAYRAWEIIPKSYNNYIIPPDFTYTVLSGTDVVRLEEKASLSAADDDWMNLTALKEGVAVIEVTYDAIQVSGGDFDGVYGASDPARSGLVVVQVGGKNDTSVNFGIDSFTSIGKVGTKNISYNPNNQKAWDAEFDTLYFTGSTGELTLKPTAGSGIQEVAISHNKGASFSPLTGDNGVYTAKIVPGNNILRIKTGAGTAYQVVRGDKINIRVMEVSGKSDGDGIVEAGETVRVSLVGLHNPIPKMAGNYNPGYGGNYDGYSSQHLNYTANGEAIYGPGLQYNFITTANYVEVVMPEDGSSVTLKDGYIGLGVLGLTAFTDGGDSHRNIPDDGCITRGSESTWHTRSILPVITLNAGSATSGNSAPIVRANAIEEAGIYADQNFAINPDTLFEDPDGNDLTFTVSVDGGAAKEIGVDYKFTPGKVGTFTLTFTASDGKLTATHSLKLTVTERPKEEEKDNTFGLEPEEIVGYVTVGFEDRGIRVEGEKGLKYPVALGTIVAPTKVPFKKGENIAQVTKRLLDHLNIGMSHSGSLTSNFYLGAISNFEVNGTPYGSMGEFDAGAGSGWMITLNGWFIDAGASAFAVKDGDAIQWKYTCQVGADIGDTFYATVKDVMKLIDEIGETITLDSEKKINAARIAYDKLPADQKSRVTNYKKLTDAETKLAELKPESDAKEIYKITGEYLEKLGNPAPGSIGGEWMALGLIRSGRKLADADAYYASVVQFVQENINENGQLHKAKSTENSRIILALTAMGKDVTNVGGYNLLTGLSDMDFVRKQGINGPIWALIALDSGNYPAPEGMTREALIQVILEAQLADGGWALTGTVSDADMTGMALQALAPYRKSNLDVRDAIDTALTALCGMQAEDGSFGSIDGKSSESVAQVVAALSALGIDADTDPRFLKNGNSALDALCTFFVEGGGFKHIPSGKLDGMATEQSYYALVAYYRVQESKTALFDMTDVVDMGGDVVEEAEPTEAATEEAESVPMDMVTMAPPQSRSFPWGLVALILGLSGAIVVLLVVSRKRK